MSSRAVGRKVRTGCITCKYVPDPVTSFSFRILLTHDLRARRVKCDEGKPSCTNCNKTGRKCDGYGPTSNVLTKGLAPTTSTTPLNVPIRGLDVTVPGTVVERRHFDYFQHRTASDLAGYFDSEFWSQIVLRVSHFEPAVRHAVIALGSLHETLNKHGQEFGIRPRSISGREQSLQQYDKSVTALRARMGSEDESSILEVALICCVLFNSFETLHGNHDQALIHLQNGLKMLQEEKAKRAQTTVPPGPSSVQYELSQVISRLNVQARALLDPELPAFHNLTETVYSRTVPETFTDLNQARDFLYAMYNDGFSFYQSMVEQMGSLASTPASKGSEPLSLLTEFGRLNSYLIQWISAFDMFIERSTSTMTSRELRGATLLRIHYLCGFIVVHKSIQPQQCAFDTYNSQFEQIVSLSTALADSTEGPDSASPTPAFSVDFGLIAPLYYTAISCRDPHIRRRAVSVLSSPRHEGAWSAVDAARVGFLAIQVEEESLGEVHSSKDVPESSRLSEINLKASEGDRIHLTCIFSGAVPPQEPVVKEYWMDGYV